jgi:dynein intermediate chain
MSGLQGSIAASKEEKKKRLLELQEKKRLAEQQAAKKAPEIKTPRASRPADASINDIMQRVMTTNEAKPPPVPVAVEEPAKPTYKPVLGFSPVLAQISLKGRPKRTTKEDEAQADLPKEPKEKPGDQITRMVSNKHHAPDAKEKPKESHEEEGENLTEKILRSSEIHEFLEKSSRIVERALGQEDPTLYTPATGDLKNIMTLYSNEYSYDRCVSSLQWSPRFNELLLTSYLSVSRSMSSELRGLICLWSLTLKNRPEYVLRCQSSVTSTTFNKFDHNLVIAGSYSGQIVVWDLRTKSHPIQRTPLMAESHTHPVYCVSIIGSQHANNIVSASNDGKVCVWSLNMFSNPTSSFELKGRVKDVGCTCMAFPDNETNLFYVGAEDGSIFQTQLHGNRLLDNNTEAFESHYGPITGLDIHPVGENIFTDLTGNLLLSSSVDWSVKLWNPKTSKNPIFSFDIYDDYIFDTKWNPVHPAVFAVAEGTGIVDLWNLNKDVEMPISRMKSSKEAINKIAWGSDGDMLATGNCNGEVKVFKVPQEFYEPTPEDWSVLENLISPN